LSAAGFIFGEDFVRCHLFFKGMCLMPGPK